MSWHRIRIYNRPPVTDLIASAKTPTDVASILLTASTKLAGASDDTRRKWQKAARQRLEELEARRLVTA